MANENRRRQVQADQFTLRLTGDKALDWIQDEAIEGYLSLDLKSIEITATVRVLDIAI